MIFSGPHWAAGVLQILLAAAEILFAVKVASKNKFIAKAGQTLIGVYFLIYKTCEYVIFRKPPVDFSAVAYFLFGIAAVLPIRPLKSVSAFCGVVAGSLFILTFGLVPEVHFENMATPFLLGMAFVNHNLIFLGMFCVLSTVKLKKTDLLWIAGFLLVLVLYGEIMAGKLGFSEAEILTHIVDGSVILYVFPDFSFSWWYYVVYYILAAVILAGSVVALRKIGNKIN